jgi:hypothetical protein|mmetsp:Transcript_35067/g.58754  ORF Transcript_35067/g.58754 Transcript_35067/m.58754 type:complete len:107 (+) Transcript_35067:3673-3993(+)
MLPSKLAMASAAAPTPITNTNTNIDDDNYHGGGGCNCVSTPLQPAHYHNHHTMWIAIGAAVPGRVEMPWHGTDMFLAGLECSFLHCFVFFWPPSFCAGPAGYIRCN